MKKEIKRYLRLGDKAVRHPILASRRIWYNMRRTTADILYPFGYCNYPYRFIFLVGMSLGGSTWMKTLLARIPGVFTRVTPMPFEVAYRQDICDSAFLKCPKNYGNTLFKTHLNPTRENLECISRNGVEKILVTYRDFRDVVVSHYYRLLVTPKPVDACDYRDYRAMEKETAIDYLIEDAAEYSVPWVRGWFQLAKEDPDRYHFTRYEDMKENTKKAFKGALDFYQIKLPEKKIDKIIKLSRGRGTMEKNLKAEIILPSGLSTNFRSGKVGSWRGEFSKSNISKCKELLGDALIEFNYEKDLNW